MAIRTKNVIKIYGALVFLWLTVATYGSLFTSHGEYGVSSHLWLTITGAPLSFLSWFFTPHGTFMGTILSGIIGILQWGFIAELSASKS